MIKPYNNQPRNNRVLLTLSGLIAVIGLADSIYLTITHYTYTLVPCNFTHACETVLRSKYAEVLGVPVAVMGIVFYVVVLAACVFFWQHKTYHWWLSIWGTIGFVSTLYLFYLQAFVLHAFCQYCLVSAATSTGIFILTSMLYLRNKKKSDTKEESN